MNIGYAQIGKPISHNLWSSLLKKHVDKNGSVNYEGFIKDSLSLNRYLRLLSNNKPNSRFWSEDETKAYWINAYNAFTIRLIIRNYPLESIRDLNHIIDDPAYTIWHKRFIDIGGAPYSLDEIEHRILRRDFDDPNIHFGLNCAAYSCPKLIMEAYYASSINNQLEQNAREFINNKELNSISESKIQVSQIFNWFLSDFTTNNESLIDFLNKYSNTKINSDAIIDFKDYDWHLNSHN